MSSATRPTRLSIRACCTLALAAASIAGVPRAAAQARDMPEPLPRATLLSTSGATTGDAGLDSAIHAALERLGVVTVAARPGLDLRAVQLAIGCTGDSPRCLRAVTAQSDVQILIAPSLHREEGALTFQLMYFDARNEHDVRRVVHEQDGEELSSETLDAIPELLRELFRLPEEGSAAPPGAAVAGQASDGAGAEPHASGPSIVPPLLACSVGLLALGGGIVTGVLMRNSEHDYQSLRITTEADVDTAVRKRSLAKSEARAANILYGVGAGALTIGGVWLAVALTHRRHEPAPQTALLPWVAPGQLGITLIQRGPTL